MNQGVRLLRPPGLGADLPLPPVCAAMTFAPVASAFFTAGLLAAGAGVVGPVLPLQEHASTPSRAAAAARVSPSPQQPGPATPEDVAVPADSVLGLQLETPVSMRPEGDERVVARTTSDVIVNGQVAVPVGMRVLGTAVFVEKPLKGREGPRLEIRFDTLELPGGERVEIETEPVVRDAARSGGLGLTRVGGGAAGGALVGAILGGGRGAAVGGVLGAAGAAATAPDRGEAGELRAGTVLSVRTREEFTVKRQ